MPTHFPDDDRRNDHGRHDPDRTQRDHVENGRADNDRAERAQNGNGHAESDPIQGGQIERGRGDHHARHQTGRTEHGNSERWRTDFETENPESPSARKDFSTTDHRDAEATESAAAKSRAGGSERAREQAASILSWVAEEDESASGDHWSGSHWKAGDPDSPPGLSDTTVNVSTVDEMVVYLDGQLEDQQREELEKKLLDDPDARQHLAALQQSWDALEALPRASCSHSFTESTVKLVVQDALLARNEQKVWRQSMQWVACSVAALAFLTVGFIATRQWVTWEDRQLLQQMDLVDNWEKYEAVGSLDLLKRLNDEDLFAQDMGDAAE